MPPTHSQPDACPLPLQNSLIIDSETESESELESQPDKEEYYIENQCGLPEYQRGNIRSSPPPGNADISNDLNIKSEFFFLKEWFAKKNDFTVCQNSLQSSSQCKR